MHNTTTPSLRQPQDVSVADAAATTLLSVFLLRVVQWIATSGLSKVIFIIAISGMIAMIMGSPQPTKKGLNGDRHILSKKHV